MLAIFLDIETTGLDPFRHNPIDIAFKVLDMTSGEEIGAYQSLVKPTLEDWAKRDLGSMEINGYTWDKIQWGKTLSEVRQDILSLFSEWKITRGQSVFICQNPSFDRSFFGHIIDPYTQEKLNWPYHWLDFASMYWALLVKKSSSENQPFPKSLNLSKNAIGWLYNLMPEILPHQAMNGVNHLIECYRAVVGIGACR